MKTLDLSRRSFIATATVAGAAAAIGALSGCTKPEVKPNPEPHTEEVVERNWDFYTTSCHGCICTCPVKVYVEDGVVRKIEGHPSGAVNHGSACVKCLNQIHTCYSPRRVLYPMRRTGARGAENMAFERISWNEAIEEASDKWLEVFEKYGTYSMMCSTGGGGAYVNAGVPPKASASCFAPTAFEPGAAQCWMPRLGMTQLMGFRTTDSMADNSVREPFKGFSKIDQAAGIKNDSKVLVLWGTQPSSSQTARAGRGMAELRATGCKTIVVDPMLTPDAAKATIHLPLRPGSDCALILSWYRYIFENKLYNEEFTKYWTNLPCLIDTNTWLPVEAKDEIKGYVPTTPDNTPVYLCIEEGTGEVKPLPFGKPEEVGVNPSVFGEAVVNGKTCKTAGQIYKEQADFWTLERAAKFCWLDAKKIEEAIKLYVSCYQQGLDGGCGIAHGVATDMMECASQAPLGTAGLDSIMGYIQKPGTTINLVRTGGELAPMPEFGGPPLAATNKWGKCVPDGIQDRPTINIVELQSCFGLGWILGASEAENIAKYEAQKSPEQSCYQRLMLDRIGVSKHRALAHWTHSHIPSVREAVETGEPYRPRLWLDVSGNKLAALGSAGAWYNAALKNVDYVIHQYPNFTSFDAELTDMFFPTEEWLEMWNPGATELNLTIPAGSITHLGESLDPLRPFYAFLERFYAKANANLDKIVFNGTGQTLAELGVKMPLVDLNAVRAVGSDASNRAQAINTGAKVLGLTAPEGESITEDQYREAWRNNNAYGASVPPDEFWTYGHYLVMANDGLPMGFPTISRKIEVYCTSMIRMSQTGFPYHWPKGYDHVDPRLTSFNGEYAPICVVPKQRETPKLDDEFKDFVDEFDPDFPLAITSGRRVFYHHGTMRHAPFSRELYPAPFAYINPETAAEYGIADGDWVEVSSRRTAGTTYDSSKPGTERAAAGQKDHATKTAEPIHAIAYVSQMVAPKVVWMERFWNPECFDSTQAKKTGGWAECNVNVITNAVDANCNEAFGSYTNRAFAVSIKKSTRPDRVWVTPEEFQPFMPTTPNETTAEVGVLMENAAMRTTADFSI